jgi:ribosome-binding factor A
MKNRPEHLASEIRKQLALEIQADFQESIITITDVVTTPDLMHANVWIKILGKNIFGSILKETPKYRAFIASKLKLRRAPELNFILDNIDLEIPV